jgi:hypothetical protein
MLSSLNMVVQLAYEGLLKWVDGQGEKLMRVVLLVSKDEINGV